MPMLADMRFACRSLFRDLGFTLTALVTLGIGIALFLTAATVTRAYLLRGLPYPEADRLYSLQYAEPGQPAPREMERLDWAALGDVIEHPIAWDLDAFFMLGGEHAEVLNGAWITPDFVEGIGVQAALGRGISREAFAEGGPNEVLISHRLWRARFGGTPDVLGRSFTAYVADRPQEAESFTIVGVLPATFWHLNAYTDVFAPLRAPTYPYMVRLRPGVPADVAAARVTSLVRAGARDVPDGWNAGIVSVHEQYVASVRPTLRATTVAGVLVLLVACANVAALLLVRGLKRRQEVVIRAALGAGRGAIARLLATEALVLGLGAAGLALLASAFALDGLAPIIQQQIGRSVPRGAAALTIDPPLIIFGTAVGLLTALICSLAPLTVLVRRRVLGSVQGATRSTTAGRTSARFRSALIALEIAASLSLLVGAALMFRSAQALGRVDLGIAPEGVMTGSLALRQSRYPEAPARLAVLESILNRLAAAPGNEAVAYGSMWPLQQAALQPVRSGEGRETRAAGQLVSPSYFDTLAIPLRAGRAFSATDRIGTERVVIISETLARRLWDDGNAVGQYLTGPSPHTSEPEIRRRVVGVVADVRQGALDGDLADVYVPMLQEPNRFAFAFIRSSTPADRTLASLRETIRQVDPEIAIDRTAALADIADRSVAGSRLLASLLAGFAIAAAGLSLVGVYGAVAYAVRQRERELAVRVAIGADPSQIVRLMVRQSALVLAAGIALGLAGSLVVGRLLESQLFGVAPADPIALAGMASAFGVAALAATWVPARRASLTDPAIALRAE